MSTEVSRNDWCIGMTVYYNWLSYMFLDSMFLDLRQPFPIWKSTKTKVEGTEFFWCETHLELDIEWRLATWNAKEHMFFTLRLFWYMSMRSMCIGRCGSKVCALAFGVLLDTSLPIIYLWSKYLTLWISLAFPRHYFHA